MNNLLQFKPKQVIRVLSRLIIFISITVGLLGILGRQQAEIVVKWDIYTGSYGSSLNLYRSENPVGEYVKINGGAIPSSTDQSNQGSYRYKDRDVIPGRIYYYQLEEITSSGVKNLYGPIEVEAIPGGTSEILLAITLLGLGVLGVLATRDEITKIS